MKFWVKTEDFLNLPILAQKCFLFLGIPRAISIDNFFIYYCKLHIHYINYTDWKPNEQEYIIVQIIDQIATITGKFKGSALNLSQIRWSGLAT